MQIQNIIGAILIIVITVLIIKGLNNLFFKIPSDIERIANSLEMIAINMVKEKNPPRIKENLTTNQDEDLI